MDKGDGGRRGRAEEEGREVEGNRSSMFERRSSAQGKVEEVEVLSSLPASQQ
jgi:hypothetical protein